jgi:hypothetical protein
LRHDRLDINRQAKNEMWMHISIEMVLHTKWTAVAVPFIGVDLSRPLVCHTLVKRIVS